MVKYPGDWKIVKAGELVKVIRGVSYKDSDVHRAKQNDDCLILRGGNILENGTINIAVDDNVYVNRSLISEAQFLRENDIVIVASTASMRVIGKSAIVDKNYINVAPGAFLLLIRPVHDDNIFAPYIAQYFRTNLYRDNIRRLVAGGVIQNIRRKYITDMLIPLPPLDEQTAIANTLTALDKEISSLEAERAKISNIRDGAMNDLLTGKVRLKNGN